MTDVQFVQLTLPAPMMGLVARAIRTAVRALVELPQSEQPSEAILGQLTLVAEFFEEVDEMPSAYPVTGSMAKALKKRSRLAKSTAADREVDGQGRALRGSKLQRKRGQRSRHQSHLLQAKARKAARPTEVDAYNERVAALEAATDITQPGLRKLVLEGTLTIEAALDIAAEEKAMQAELAAQERNVVATRIKDSVSKHADILDLLADDPALD